MGSSPATQHPCQDIWDHALAGELQLPTGRLYRPLPALYWVVFADFIILAAGETSWLALRTSRFTEDEFVRRGLRCVTVGTLILSGFYGQYAGGVVGRLISSRLPGPLRGVPAQAVIGTSAAVIAGLRHTRSAEVWLPTPLVGPHAEPANERQYLPAAPPRPDVSRVEILGSADLQRELFFRVETGSPARRWPIKPKLRACCPTLLSS